MNYFNDSIAILTIGIGSLFSGIEVHRNDKGVFKVIKVPLMFAGAGLLKGFALTTILGVSVGVFITRPAYAAIVELLIKED